MPTYFRKLSLASLSNVRIPYLTEYALLAFVFLVARSYFHNGITAWYFPDSWDYIVVPESGGADALHSPWIYQIWKFLTFGSFTEKNVVNLQIFIGLLTILLAFNVVKFLSSRLVALMASLFLAILPTQIFFERVLLTETFVNFFICTYLFFLLLGHYTKSRAVLVASLTLALASLGQLIALKPSWLLPGSILLVFTLGDYSRSYVRESQHIGMNHSKQFYFLGILVAILSVTIPLYKLSTIYESQFGFKSLSPAQGSVIAATWSPLIPCDSYDEAETTALAIDALAQICEANWSEIPGRNVNVLWREGPVSSSMDPHSSFIETQRALREVTLTAIRSDIGTFSKKLRDSLWWQFTKKPEINLELYVTSELFANTNSAKKYFESRNTWFVLDYNKTPKNNVLLFKSIESYSNLPRILFYVSLVLAFVHIGAISAGLNARSFSNRTESFFTNYNPKFASQPFAFGAILMIVLLNVGSNALAGAPIFRYQYPLFIPLVALVAIVIPVKVSSLK
jgi:hypothetical protein